MRADHRFLRFWRARLAAALVIAIALAGASGAFGVPSARAEPRIVAASTDGYCSGPTDPTDYSGSLSVEGGPVALSAAGNVELTYSSWVESTVNIFWNDTTVTSCSLATGNTTTTSDGNFSFAIPPPSPACWNDPNPPGGLECANYSGPYGPVSVAPVLAPPAGYALSTESSGASFDLTWVAGLATVSLDPGSEPIVVATDAPSPVLALPMTANGTASSIVPQFAWGLNGSGWSFVGAAGDSDSVTVVAAPGAANGELNVRANATVGANSFETPSIEVSLVATPTNLTSGELATSVVDAGRPLAIHVVATGAPGYAYTATVAPGLGEDPFVQACTTATATTTTVSVQCTPSVTYSSPGTTEVTVDVSNGYSSATWTSPELVVDPAPALTVNPTEPTGYAGTPIPLTVSMAPGSGTPPYRSACLVAPPAPGECVGTPGPNWTFNPTFASAGNFSATASVLDSSGANTTASLTVGVVSPLAIGAVAPGVANVTIGSTVTLPSSVSGGVLPAEVWWNVSGEASPLAEYSVDTDGPVTAVFSPASLGPANVAVTVRDALGTRAEANRTVAVVTGPVTAIVAPDAESPIAGSMVPLTWEALDADQGVVPSFAEAGTLSIEGPSGIPALAWANVSGLGALSVAPEASFVVPSSAWSVGRLSFDLTPMTAGALSVNWTGEGPFERSSGVSLDVAPDETHLRLFAPTVIRGGWEANETFWHVSDRFGNPVPGAEIVLQYSYGGASVDRSVPVVSEASGGTVVWVNFTLPGAGASVRVLDLAGDLLLGPISEPGPVGPPLALAASVLSAASGVGAASALLPTVPRSRARRRAVADEETAARALAEGRATVVEIVRQHGPLDWAGILERWEPPPPPPDLEEWVASLVADGTLLERPGARDGIEYALAPAPTEPGRIVIDPEAIDRALARRDAAVYEGPDEPGAG